MYNLGQFQVDYEERVEYRELRRKRLERVWAAMEEAGLDALIVWRDENVRYTTSLRPQLIAGKSGLLNGAVIFPKRQPVLLVSGGDWNRAQERMPWLEELVPIPIMEEPGLIEHFVSHSLKRVLSDRNVTRGRIGVDQAPWAFIQLLHKHFPHVEWTDGDKVMRSCRLIKFPEEIQIMEEASAIAEAVTRVAIDAVREGVRECEVAGEAMRELYRLGGEYAHVVTPFVASGEHMSPPTRLCTDKIIRNGDLVFIDIGAMWNGYYADIGRTVFCGKKPSPKQKAIYRAVYDALQACVATMKPGVTNVEVADAIRAAAAEHGFGDRFLSLFIGHGIGIGSNEPPYIGENFPGAETVVLQPGMTFAVEPLIWVPDVPGGGGVRLEDTIVVTEDGCRVISRSPYDERFLE